VVMVDSDALINSHKQIADLALRFAVSKAFDTYSVAMCIQCTEDEFSVIRGIKCGRNGSILIFRKLRTFLSDIARVKFPFYIPNVFHLIRLHPIHRFFTNLVGKGQVCRVCLETLIITRSRIGGVELLESKQIFILDTEPAQFGVECLEGGYLVDNVM